MLPRERVSYSTPFDRAPLKLPGNAKMVVWPVVNVEEWELSRPMARQASPAPMGVSAVPDLSNWTWHEYGMRVGFWRLKQVLDAHGISPTLSLNAAVCETCPELVQAVCAAGWEIMAHCVVQMPISQVNDENAMIVEALDRIERFTGKRPRGWLGPGRSQTLQTPDILKKNGLEWFGDWIIDDQPVWVDTLHGPLLSIPYSVELNDITVMISGQQESGALLTRVKDAFDCLYRESEQSPRLMAIGVHPYVSGAAHRIRYYDEIFRYINQHDGVLYWNGQHIHDWFSGEVSAPRIQTLAKSHG
jgi:allantoinase